MCNGSSYSIRAAARMSSVHGRHGTARDTGCQARHGDEPHDAPAHCRIRERPRQGYVRGGYQGSRQSSLQWPLRTIPTSVPSSAAFGQYYATLPSYDNVIAFARRPLQFHYILPLTQCHACHARACRVGR